MISPIERARELSRGWRAAAPASASRLAALNTFGLRYIEEGEHNVIVEGDYRLNLPTSFWRALDGSEQGYLVSNLSAAVRRHHEPAAGRDSDAANNGPEPSIGNQAAAIAESAAGPALVPASEDFRIEGGWGTASLLPMVRP